MWAVSRTDDNDDSFYDAEDDLEDVILTKAGEQSPFRPDTSTLRANEEFSTCKGDTLREFANSNYKENELKDYASSELDVDVVDSSLSSENRETEDFEHSRSIESSTDLDVSRRLSANSQKCSELNESSAPPIILNRCSETDSDKGNEGNTDLSTSPGSSYMAGKNRWRRGEHLSLEILNSGVTSDSGNSFTPSDVPEYLSLPHPHGKTNSLPSNDVTELASSPCEFFKTLDKSFDNMEDSASDHSESTNTTQETRSSKKFAIGETPRRFLTRFKNRKGKKENSNSVSGSSVGANIESSEQYRNSHVRSDSNESPLSQHIPSYVSDNYPEDRERNFCKSTTIVQTMESHQHNLAIWCLKFSACGKYLAAAGQDKTIRVWVLRCEFENLSLNAGSSRSSIANLGSLPYASQKSSEGSLKTNSLKSDDSNNPDTPLSTTPFLPEPYRTFSKHSSDVMDIAWSPQNSSYLLSASMDKNVRLWHIHMNKCLGAFDHQNIVTCVSFPPRDVKANVFLSGAMDGKVRIWSITEKKVLTFYEATGGKKQPITCMCYSNCGEYILIGTLSGQILKLDSVQLRLLNETRVLSSKSSKLRRSNIKIVSIQEAPRSAGTFLVSSSDCRIRLFETSTATTSATSSMRESVLGSDRSVSNPQSGTGSLFWKQKAKYKGHSNKNSPIRTGFSRLGNFIISGSECKSIFIWNTEPVDGKYKNTIFESIQSHTVSVTAATFSPTVEAIDCLDRCQRRLQQQHQKVQAMNSCLSGQSNDATLNAPGESPGNQFLDVDAVNKHGRSPHRRHASVNCDSSSYAPKDKEPLTAVLNFTRDDLNIGPVTLNYPAGCGMEGSEGTEVSRASNCSPRFTVKNLIVGEVFASADYTGKINVYFA